MSRAQNEILSLLAQFMSHRERIIKLFAEKPLAVCSVQTARGTRLSTSFIGNGTAVAGTRRATAWTYCAQPISDWHPCRERTGQCRPLGQNQAR